MVKELTPELIQDVNVARTFTLGGNATFTVEGKSKRFTFKVEVCRDKPELWFVKVLTGSQDWSYLGTIRQFPDGVTHAYKHGAKSRISETATSALTAKYVFRSLFGTGYQATFNKYDFYHEGTCGRCGRPLTDPESIQSGIGPVCRGKMGI